MYLKIFDQLIRGLDVSRPGEVDDSVTSLQVCQLNCYDFTSSKVVVVSNI